jgi:N-acyl-D-aspartate/D-glutamate deacylase
MADFDIVIHGGRIIDGAGNPWFYADVGIKDGRIASIGRINPESGRRAISAKGMVVTPGYIDMHTHSDQPIINDGNADTASAPQAIAFAMSPPVRMPPSAMTWT